MSYTIFAIDSHLHNLTLITKFLDSEGYKVKGFTNSAEVLKELQAGARVDVIMLARVMPDMDSVSFLANLKSLPELATVPVVLETVAGGPQQVIEDADVRAYYYVTEPYSREVVRSTVKRALEDHSIHRGLEEKLALLRGAFRHIEKMTLSFRTMEDVRNISLFVAALYPDPTAALLGVTEMLINAVEHGNLGLTYDDKSTMIRSGLWQDEIQRRLQLPEYRDRAATVSITRTPEEIVLKIEDEGEGFDTSAYDRLDFAASRKVHGRGIVMSRMVSFDNITFVAPGNVVICSKSLLAE